MPVPESLRALRVVADPAALDSADWPPECDVLRLAADEILVLGTEAIDIDDPEAIVFEDHGFCAVRMPLNRIQDWLAREAEWTLPTDGQLIQGMAAGLPVKIWCRGDEATLITRASLRHDLEARL